MKRARVARGLTFPFPKSKAERDKVIQNHLDSRSKGGPMHYFVKEDGSIHYVDNKGGGNYAFNDLATKLHNEANRRGRKLDATPTLEDYLHVFGKKNGPKLFQAEQQRLREIYKNADTIINDVDHIDSLGQGGLHYSRNLRELLSSENRSDGARHITDEMRNALLLAQDKRDQIALQGPDVPPPLRNLQTLQERLRNPSTYINGAMDAISLVTNGTPIGIATDIAIDTFNSAVDQPVREATGKGIYEHIPSGSQEKRRAENKKINGQLQKNNGHNGNEVGHSITNQVLYAAQKIARGELPYYGD